MTLATLEAIGEAPRTDAPTGFVITEAQKSAFWRDGFLSIPQLTTPEDIAYIRPLYDRMFAEKAGWKEGNYFDLVGKGDDPNQFKIAYLQRIGDYCPELLESAYLRNAAAVAAQLLGGRAKRLYDSAITKPPRTDAETPWHQDAAFLMEESYFETLTFWLPLQAVDEQQGCMKFLPGSHQNPIVPHHSPGGDNRLNGLEAVGIDLSDAVTCPLPAGGATVHHFRTLHGTGGNRSDIPRRVLTVGFGIRRTKLMATGNHPWLAEKDNLRLRRWRHGDPMGRLKHLARPYLNFIAVGLGIN